MIGRSWEGGKRKTNKEGKRRREVVRRKEEVGTREKGEEK